MSKPDQIFEYVYYDIGLYGTFVQWPMAKKLISPFDSKIILFHKWLPLELPQLKNIQEIFVFFCCKVLIEYIGSHIVCKELPMQEKHVGQNLQ